MYSKIVKLWAFLFLGAGLVFLFFPVQLADGMNASAQLIGLTGLINAAAGTLWHILSLSLMGALVALAFASSRFPENVVFYRIIILAKSISVAGFCLLALTNGSVWIMAAAVDGFVALTLFISRKSLKADEMAEGFARLYSGNKPFYEVWYGKIDIAKGKAFWFRYTLLDGVKKEASVWALFFSEGKVQAGKNTFSIDKLAPSNCLIIPDHKETARFEKQQQVFHLGGNHLDGANAIGQAGVVSWDLQFTDNKWRYEHVPPLMKALKVTKSIYNACFLDLRFSGLIKNGDETISVENRTGMIGHIYGKKSANSWAWAHCNNFGEQNVIFEGISAQIKLGGKVSPPLNSFVFIADNHLYNFTSTVKLFTSDSVFGNGKWTFTAKSNEAVLKGEATAPANVALVEYTDTDDSNLWCYNSKLADLKLEFTLLKTGKTQTFVSQGTCAFELVNRNKPAGAVDL